MLLHVISTAGLVYGFTWDACLAGHSDVDVVAHLKLDWVSGRRKTATTYIADLEDSEDQASAWQRVDLNWSALIVKGAQAGLQDYI